MRFGAISTSARGQGMSRVPETLDGARAIGRTIPIAGPARGFGRTVEARYPAIGRLTDGSPRLHVLEAGPPGAPPVVLIHGASGNLRDWQLSILPRLAESHHVIAIDRPGFGHSARLPGLGWRITDQVAAMRRALHGLGHRRYILVGHSYGGTVVLRWAAEHPGEVLGAATLAAVAMDWGGGGVGLHYRIGGRAVIGDLLARLAPVLGPSRAPATVACIFAPDPVPPRYAAEAGIELALRPRTFRTNATMMLRLHGQVRDLVPLYDRIACPVEIVHGAADTLVPARIHAGPLGDCLARPRITLLPGIGHMPHHAAPDPVIAAIGRLAAR